MRPCNDLQYIGTSYWYFINFQTGVFIIWYEMIRIKLAFLETENTILQIHRDFLKCVILKLILIKCALATHLTGAAEYWCSVESKCLEPGILLAVLYSDPIL